MRIVAFVSTLAALGVGAYLYAGATKTASPASTQVAAAEQQAEAAATAGSFQAAATQLEGFRAENGTYEGASLPASFGLTVVRVDAGSYCVQSSGANVQHLAGPGGSPQPGPC